MKHLRFWTAVLQGLGYAFILLGTVASLLVVIGDMSSSEDTFLPIAFIGLVMLLLTWTISTLMIVFGSYVELRAEELETALGEE